MIKTNRDCRYDIVRIVAILLITIYHYSTRYNELYGHRNLIYGLPAEVATFSVSLFLIMVGYFSYTSICRESNAYDYLKKRMIRLMPTFWVALFITSAVVAFSGFEKISFLQIILNALLLNRFIGVPFVDGAYWYMIILVVYTIMATFVILFNTQIRKKILLLYTLTFCIFGVLNYFTDIVPAIVAFLTFRYVNKCVLGFWIREYRNSANNINNLAIIGLLIVFEFLWVDINTFVPDLLAVICICIITNEKMIISVHEKLGGIIIILGEGSYFYYLIHQKIGYVLIRELENLGINDLIAIIIAFFSVVLISILFNLLVNYSKGKYETKMRKTS